MGAIVSSPPGASSAVAVRVAVAASDEQGAPTARWASVTVQGSATAFAWIVPARPGALLELSPDAWLEALESATAPRVVPPDATPPCGFPGGVEVEGSFTPTATTAPGAVVVAADRPTLDAALASWGLSVTPELSPAIDAVLASGSDLVAMLFADAPETVVTRTIRVVDDAPDAVPLSLLTGGTNAVQVTAFALRSSSPAFGAQADLAVDPTAILWGSDGTSSYAPARDATLEANPGRWLLETSGPSLVSTPTMLPDGSTVPSLTSAYDSLLANGGDAGVSDDLAVALGVGGDGGTGQEWLARGRTVIPAGALGQDTPITDGSLDAIGPVVTASGYAQTCEASAPPPAQQQGGSGGGGGNSGTPSSQGTTGANGSGAVDLGASAATAAADSTDGCGGDSTDSSGDGCGGDTSSSSDGTDSSSSDSSSGCSGSTTDSSSDSGGGCSGSSDSSSSSDCSVESGSKRHARSTGTSRFLILLVGVATLCRRRARGRGA